MPRRWRKKENILRMCFEGSCSEKKGILFCAVARKGIVVARCASCVGNFSQITNSLLDIGQGGGLRLHQGADKDDAHPGRPSLPLRLLAFLLFLFFFVSLLCGGISWSVCIEE